MDAGLHGNGDDCPACALRRDDLRAVGAVDQTVPCNLCHGAGRIARPVETVIAGHVAWARAHYWSAFDERNREHGA